MTIRTGPGDCAGTRTPAGRVIAAGPGPGKRSAGTQVAGSPRTEAVSRSCPGRAVPRHGTARPGFTWTGWAVSVQQGADRAGADRPAALADGEAQAGLERDRLAELDGYLDVVAGRRSAVRAEVDHADHVGGADEELRAVARPHPGPAAALSRGQQVHAGREPLAGGP